MRSTKTHHYEAYQTFCIYCQKEWNTMERLVAHIERVHPGSIAAFRVAEPFRKWQKG